MGTKGVAVPALIFALGMSLMSLPHQFLPGFLGCCCGQLGTTRYFGEGMRSLMYQDGQLWNCATVAAIVMGLVGIAAGMIAVTREKRYWDLAKA